LDTAGFAVQATNRQVDHYRAATRGLIGHMPHVPAVLPVRELTVDRARDRDARAGARHDPDQLPAGLNLVDLHRDQLRQQDLDLDVTVPSLHRNGRNVTGHIRTGSQTTKIL